jgi:hypothetical protein
MFRSAGVDSTNNAVDPSLRGAVTNASSPTGSAPTSVTGSSGALSADVHRASRRLRVRMRCSPGFGDASPATRRSLPKEAPYQRKGWSRPQVDQSGRPAPGLRIVGTEGTCCLRPRLAWVHRQGQAERWRATSNSRAVPRVSHSAARTSWRALWTLGVEADSLTSQWRVRQPGEPQLIGHSRPPAGWAQS